MIENKKAIKLFDEYYTNQIKISQQQFYNSAGIEEIPKVEPFGDEIVKVIFNTLGGCYYFLDDNNIKISTTWNSKTNKFYFTINDEIFEKEYSNRMECEKESLIEAFKLLEQKL